MKETQKTRLWDPEFKYTPAASTQIRDLFARIKAQQQKQQRLHTVKGDKRA